MSEAPSLRETLQSAYAELSAAEEGGVAPAAAAQGAPASGETNDPPAPDGAEAPAARPGKEAAPADDKEGRARDVTGKFAKSDKVGQNASPESASAGEAAPPEGETSRPPPGLAAPLKAAWKDLPPEWRQAFAKQEDSFKVVRDAWQPNAERLNRLDEVLASRRERLALNGVSEVQWLQSLAAAEDMLERNPVDGLRALAQRYRVDLRQLASQMSGPQGAQQAQLPPELQALYGKVETLEQQQAQQRNSAFEAQRATALAQIQEFANDPANLYFENVKGDVAALLAQAAEARQSLSLKDAYDKACWANPEIREILLQEKSAEATRQAQAAQARAKAQAAAKAGGSVTGAPGAGGALPGGVDPTNLREVLKAAYHEASGGI